MCPHRRAREGVRENPEKTIWGGRWRQLTWKCAAKELEVLKVFAEVLKVLLTFNETLKC